MFFLFQTDSPQNVCSILYVPSRKISRLEFTASAKEDCGVSLYNIKVLSNLTPKSYCPTTSVSWWEWSTLRIII
jgi:hypothetical protein